MTDRSADPRAPEHAEPREVASGATLDDTQGLADALVSANWALSRRLRAEGSPDSSLSLTQLAILVHLDRTPGLTSAEVAREEMVTPQSINVAVTELRKLGYVSASPVEGDGRRLALALTPAGQAALEATRRRRSAWLVEFLEQDMTPDERRTLADALSALRRASATWRARNA